MKENHPIYKEEREQMKKITGCKKGYYIRIIDGFYEVIDGNRVIHFGECRKNSTIQEIANKTILNQMEESDVTYRKRRIESAFRKEVSRGHCTRCTTYERKDVAGMSKRNTD